jgi:hypothetical protein
MKPGVYREKKTNTWILFCIYFTILIYVFNLFCSAQVVFLGAYYLYCGFLVFEFPNEKKMTENCSDRK